MGKCLRGILCQFRQGRHKKRRKLQEDKTGKLSLARIRVLREVGDCFGRETVRPKEEEEEEEGGGLRSAGTKRSWPGAPSLSQRWS